MVDELKILVSDINEQARELAEASNAMNNISRGLGLLAEQVGDSVQIVSAGSQNSWSGLRKPEEMLLILINRSG